jgi:hypothetical protein
VDINFGPDMFSWQLEKLQTLNNAQQWISKDKQVQTILVRLSFIPSTPTHNEDSWGSWQQLTNWASNLWKRRSQLIVCKNSRDSFQECTTPLSSFNFLEELTDFLEHCLMLSLWNRPPKRKIFTLKLQSPSSLLGYNTLPPPPLSHYSLPKPKVPYSRSRCAYIDWSS